MTEEQRSQAEGGSLPPDEALRREFQAARDQYLDVLTRIVKEEPERVTCGVGAICNIGQTKAQ